VTEQHGEEQLGLARQALAAARTAARIRGARAPRRDAASAAGPAAQPATQPGSDGTRPAHSGRPPAEPGFAARPRRDDPVPLATALDGLLDAEGWALAVATGSVFGRWAEIVGPDLAAHTTPEGLSDGELTVAADSTAWATQVRLLAAQLVLRLNRELGDGTVLRVRVHGPAAPGRRRGEWRVRGGRGPRDTYG
jgi:predicted nucleic acid-binding Zn ribbon protein